MAKPVISSILPVVGYEGDSLVMAVTEAQTITAVDMEGQAAAFTPIDLVSISVTVPAGITTALVNVTATNPDDTSDPYVWQYSGFGQFAMTAAGLEALFDTNKMGGWINSQPVYATLATVSPSGNFTFADLTEPGGFTRFVLTGRAFVGDVGLTHDPLDFANVSPVNAGAIVYLIGDGANPQSADVGFGVIELKAGVMPADLLTPNMTSGLFQFTLAAGLL